MAITCTTTTGSGLLSACFGPPATAVNVVQTAVNQQTGVTSIAATFTNPQASGNSNGVAIQCSIAGDISSVTDTDGNAYFLVDSQTNGLYNLYWYACAGGAATAAGPTSSQQGGGGIVGDTTGGNQVTVAFTASVSGVVMAVEVSGSAGVDWNFVSATGTTTGSTATLAAQFPVALVVVAAIGNSLSAPTPGSGFTAQLAGSDGVANAYILETQLVTNVLGTTVTCAATGVAASVAGAWTTIAISFFATAALPSSDCTVSFWCKTTSHNADVLFQVAGFVEQGHEIVSTSGGVVSFQMPGGAGPITGPTVTIGLWYFFALSLRTVAGQVYAKLYWKVEGAPTCSVGSNNNNDGQNAFQPGQYCVGVETSYSNGGANTLANISESYAGTFAAVKIWRGWLAQSEIEAESRQYAPRRRADLFDYAQFRDTADLRTPQGLLFQAPTPADISSASGPPIPLYALPPRDRRFGRIPRLAGQMRYPDAATPAPTHPAYRHDEGFIFVSGAPPVTPTQFPESYPEAARDLRASVARHDEDFYTPITAAAVPVQFPASYPLALPAAPSAPIETRQWDAGRSMAPERTQVYLDADFPDRVAGPQPRQQMAVAAIGPSPERTAPLASADYPARVDGSPPRQHADVAILPLAPERTSPLVATAFPDVVQAPAPRGQGVAVTPPQYAPPTPTQAPTSFPASVPGAAPRETGAYTVPAKPERVGPLAAQDYPAAVPPALPRAHLAVAAGPLAPERATLAPTPAVYPDAVPAALPRGLGYHEEPAAPERTVPVASQVYPDTAPGPTPRAQLATSAGPQAPERTSPLVASSFPDRQPPPLFRPFEHEQPTKPEAPIALAAHTTYPDRVPGAWLVTALYPYALSGPPLPPGAAPPAPVGGHGSFPDAVPGPAPRQHADVGALDLRPERTSPLVASSFPDRQDPPIPRQQLPTAAEPLRPERTSPAIVDVYPEAVPGALPRQQGYAEQPPAPERKSPLASQTFPDAVPGPLPRAQMPTQAGPVAPERMAPLAAQTFPDTVPAALPRQHADVAAINLRPEAPVPDAVHTVYPERVPPAPAVPTAALPFATLPPEPERKAPLAAQWYPEVQRGPLPRQPGAYVVPPRPERTAPIAVQLYPERVPGLAFPPHAQQVESYGPRPEAPRPYFSTDYPAQVLRPGFDVRQQQHAQAEVPQQPSPLAQLDWRSNYPDRVPGPRYPAPDNWAAYPNPIARAVPTCLAISITRTVQLTSDVERTTTLLTVEGVTTTLVSATARTTELGTGDYLTAVLDVEATKCPC